MPSPLLNKTILVTRPQGRHLALCDLIAARGGHCLHYPVISIEPPHDLDIEQLMQLRDQLHRYTMAIFISPTAVEQSAIYFPVLPEHFTVAAIGSKTSHALLQQNIPVDLVAPGHNSESLLTMEAMQMPHIEGQRVLIFRGNGGRNLLGDTLVKRGAQVRYVETYQRRLPPHPPLQPDDIARLDAITISSNESLDNLITLMEDPTPLVDIPLLVPSPRAMTLARQHGFKTIVQAENATDEAFLEALQLYFTRW